MPASQSMTPYTLSVDGDERKVYYLYRRISDNNSIRNTYEVCAIEKHSVELSRASKLGLSPSES
jgi:hypothetical protein